MKQYKYSIFTETGEELDQDTLAYFVKEIEEMGIQGWRYVGAARLYNYTFAAYERDVPYDTAPVVKEPIGSVDVARVVANEIKGRA